VLKILNYGAFVKKTEGISYCLHNVCSIREVNEKLCKETGSRKIEID
jgi:hypothetical protein